MPDLGSRATLLLRSLSWVTASSLLSLTTSVLVALVLPKVLGVEEYGYFQLFLFFSSYAGALTLGWLDGMHLRYGGSEYADLDASVLSSQLRLLIVTQLAVSAGIAGIAFVVPASPDHSFVLVAFAMASVLLNLRGLPIVLLQATYRAREFARLVVIERAAYVVLLIIAVISGSRDYRVMVGCALVALLIGAGTALRSIGDVVRHPPTRLTTGWREVWLNVVAGLPLLISNVAGMLMIGVMRLVIERRWGIAAFGGVSLLLSLAGLAVAVVNVVGLVIFPLFRRLSTDRLRANYVALSTLLSATLLGLLVSYYPLRAVLELWLPTYASAWGYLVWILPVAVYESKQVLLLNTLLKVMRKERLLLAINVMMLGLAVVVAVITGLVLARIELVIGSITLLVFLRALASELQVGRLLGLRLAPAVVLETAVVMSFIILGSTIESWLIVPLFLAVYGVYLLLRRSTLRASLRHASELLAT